MMGEVSDVARGLVFINNAMMMMMIPRPFCKSELEFKPYLQKR